MSAFFQSEMNPSQATVGMGDSSNMVAEMLNKGMMVDPGILDFYYSQCVNSIQNNLKLMGVLEQYKVSLQMQSQQEMPQINPFMSLGASTPKGSGIHAPKPLHAKCDTRIGRSHSMYVTNPVKPEVSTGDKSNGSEKQSEAVSQSSDRKLTGDQSIARKRMNVFRCPHTDRKHYAKNMCNNCYHKQGRNKKATKCPHKERQNYAKGKCQNCYLNDYHKVKRRLKKQTKASASKQEEVDRRISVETASTDVKQDSKNPAIVTSEE